MKSKWTSVLAIAFVTVLVFLACGVRLYTQEQPYPLRFSEVVPQKIYRSGQPTVEELQGLRQSIGLKAIVNLRGSQGYQTDKACREEEEFARKAGLNLLVIGFSFPPTDENIKDLLRFLDDETHYPVLIHCELGKTRSGVAMAIYRIERMNWTSAQALDEMSEVKNAGLSRHRDFGESASFVAGYRPKFPRKCLAAGGGE